MHPERRDSNSHSNTASDAMTEVENDQPEQQSTSPQSQISWSNINSPVTTQPL